MWRGVSLKPATCWPEFSLGYRRCAGLPRGGDIRAVLTFRPTYVPTCGYCRVAVYACSLPFPATSTQTVSSLRYTANLRHNRCERSFSTFEPRRRHGFHLGPCADTRRFCAFPRDKIHSERHSRGKKTARDTLKARRNAIKRERLLYFTVIEKLISVTLRRFLEGDFRRERDFPRCITASRRALLS